MKKFIQTIFANKKYKTLAIIAIIFIVGGTAYACSLGLGIISDKKTTKQEQTQNKNSQKPTTEEVNNETPSTDPNQGTEPVGENQIFTLSGATTDKGISLSWNVAGLYVGNGFKVVKSVNPNPVFPGNNYQYLSNPDTRNFVWGITDGNTYHFRVCTYNGAGACLAYSNDIAVTAPLIKVEKPPVDTGVVTSISLYAVTPMVKWSVAGYSDKGFKVVWSKNAGPTYPTRAGDTYHYLSDPSAHIDTLTAFDGHGTYYVRVCEYLGGACGVYSNEVTLEL